MIIKTPEDALNIICKRAKLFKKAVEDESELLKIKEKCTKDIFYWLENFCFTYDPRPGALKDIPFIPYEFQRELIIKVINSIENSKDILVEKSRDMGVTWCILYVYQWFWQFFKGFHFHLGSKKQDNVDVIGDPSTLFGKLRYNIQLQPEWLLPEGFALNKNSFSLKIINPKTGNLITGESSNPEFSRSGRYSSILFDEFAFWQYDHEAWSAAGDSTNSRIAISTPFGKNNKFADLRFNSPIEIFTVHWKQHPFKSDKWYKEQNKRRTKDEIARELDINYVLSVEGRVYKDFDYTKHVIEDLDPIPDLQIIRTWDFGLNPAVVFSQIDKDGKWLVIDEIVPPLNLKPTISEYIPQVIEYSKKQYPDYSFKDICDIAGRQRSSHTGKTDIDWLISYGLAPIYNYVKIEEGINLVSSRLICQDFEPEPAFLISTKCPITIEAFSGAYKRKRASIAGQETTPEQEHPYEDVMDCIRYTAWEKFDAHTGKRSKRKRRDTLPDNPLTGY